MAFWDFLNQPVGGDSAPPPGTEEMSFDTSTPPIAAPQMTWGELLKTLANMSGGQQQRPLTGGALGQMVGGQGGPEIYSIAPPADFNKPQGKRQTSFGEVMSIASGLGFI